MHDGQTLLSEEDKAMVVYSFFDELLGSATTRLTSIDLDVLDLSCPSLGHLSHQFSEEEVWTVVCSLLPNKAPGPDGFTVRFLQTAWQIIYGDIMLAFEAF
jgi:hypothetical protein